MRKTGLIFGLLLLMASPAFAAGQVVKANVNGLVCDFCARAIEKVFSKQEAVQDVDVNLDTKIITIDLKPDAVLEDATITQLINDAGYTVEDIRREEAGAAHE